MQAAQKLRYRHDVDSKIFTAMQAAQKHAINSSSPSLDFTAMQAAQKHGIRLKKRMLCFTAMQAAYEQRLKIALQFQLRKGNPLNRISNNYNHINFPKNYLSCNLSIINSLPCRQLRNINHLSINHRHDE